MNKEWVFIDTHTPGRGRLGWLSKEQRPHLKSYKGRPATLLRYLFKTERERLMACAGVCVVAGPGSFSSIRIGVLYANLLARLLSKPLVGVKVEQTAEMARVYERYLSRAESSEESYVAPIYDSEPNITLPRVKL